MAKASAFLQQKAEEERKNQLETYGTTVSELRQQTKQQAAQQAGAKAPAAAASVGSSQRAHREAGLSTPAPVALPVREPMQDRAKATMQSSLYQPGEVRSKPSRVGEAVSSIGLNTAGSIQTLGEEAKAARDNVVQYQDSESAKKVEEAFNALKRAEFIYGKKSREYAEAEEAYRAARKGAEDYRAENDRGLDPNGKAVQTMRKAQEAQERALEGTSGVGRFLGESAISIADNIANMAVTGFNPAASMALMGAKAAGSRAYELDQQGVKAGQALARGALAGGIEALTEQVSIGSLLDLVKTGGKGALVNLLKQSGVEGAEEATSYILNYIADKAAKDPNATFDMGELLSQAGSGAFSGLVMGGAGTLVNRVGGGKAETGPDWADKRYEEGITGEGKAAPERRSLNLQQEERTEAKPLPTAETATQQEAVADGQEKAQVTSAEVNRIIRAKAALEDLGIERNGKTASQLRQEVRERLGIREEKMAEPVPLPTREEIDKLAEEDRLENLKAAADLVRKNEGEKAAREYWNRAVKEAEPTPLPVKERYSAMADKTDSMTVDAEAFERELEAEQKQQETAEVQKTEQGSTEAEAAEKTRKEEWQKKALEFTEKEVADARAVLEDPDAPEYMKNMAQKTIANYESGLMERNFLRGLDEDRQKMLAEEARKNKPAVDPDDKMWLLEVDDSILTRENREEKKKLLESMTQKDLDKAAERAYWENIRFEMEQIREYEGEEAALAFWNEANENAYKDGGEITWEDGYLPELENSETVQGRYGQITKAMAKLNVQPEGQIANYGDVQMARMNDRNVYAINKYIQEVEKEKRASAWEKKIARQAARGDVNLADLKYGWDGKNNRRRDVVERLAALNRQRETVQEKGTKELGARGKNLFYQNVAKIMGGVFDKVTPPKKQSLQSNTWERNNLRTFGQEVGAKINEETFRPVKYNEAHLINWINDQAKEMAFLGDLTDAENEAVYYALDSGEQIEVKEGMREGLMKKAVKELKRKYNELYDAINDVLVAHGYKEIGFIKDYTPHMQKPQMDEARSILQKLGIGDNVTELPTELAGRTDAFKPGKKWDPYFQTRNGEQAVPDAVGGFASYLKYAGEVLFHIDDIQKLRTLSDTIRFFYAQEGISEDYKAIMEDYSLTAEQREDELAKLRKRAETDTKMGGYVTALDNYANIIAGKQTQNDRAQENFLERTSLKKLQSPIKILVQSSIPANISSAINQTVQLPGLMAEAGEGNVLHALKDMVTGKLGQENFERESEFLTGKRGIDFGNLQKKTAFDKTIDTASWLFETVDDAASKLIVRSYYLQGIKNGMTVEQAIRYADEKADALVGTRIKGGKPNLYHDKNVLSKVFTTFQLEVANQYEHIKFDLPQQIRQTEKTKGKAAAVRLTAALLLKGELYTFVLNNLIEKATGNRPAGYDLIGIIMDYIRAGTPDEDDEDQSFDWETGLSDMGNNIVDDLPYVSTAAALLGYGNGRLPLPDMKPAGNILKGARKAFSGETPEEKAEGRRLASVGAYKTAAALLPMGTQARKTAEGIMDLRNGGRMSDDGSQLLYEVERTPANIARGVLFGRSAFPEADAYYEGGAKKALSKEQTSKLKSAEAAGVNRKDFVRFISETKKLESDKDENGKTVSGSLERKKIELLDGMDLTDEQKLLIYRENVASDSRLEDLDAMEAAGLGWKDISGAVSKKLELDADKSRSAYDRATAMAAWADGNLSQGGAAAVRENMKFSTGYTVEAETYDKLTAAGLDPKNAQAVYDVVSGLKPEDGKTQVSELQKAEAIAGSRMSAEQKTQALSVVMSESSYDKLVTVADYGVDPDKYVGYKKALQEHDKDGNGNYSQEEVTAAIKSMSGLSKEEKAALWQATNKSWKPKSNPFSSSVATEVYDKLNAPKPKKQQPVGLPIATSGSTGAGAGLPAAAPAQAKKPIGLPIAK